MEEISQLGSVQGRRATNIRKEGAEESGALGSVERQTGMSSGAADRMEKGRREGGGVPG
jgi:hypothetical protein